MWRPHPYPCSSHLWPWGSGREIRAQRGWGIGKGKKLRVTARWEKLLELVGKKMREKRIKTRWSKEGCRRGIGLSLPLVTPSQLPGFMASFLSWCCFLIDIKKHWPVCQCSPLLLSTPSHLPSFSISSALRAWLTWAVIYIQRGVTELASLPTISSAAAMASSSVTSERFGL